MNSIIRNMAILALSISMSTYAIDTEPLETDTSLFSTVVRRDKSKFMNKLREDSIYQCNVIKRLSEFKDETYLGDLSTISLRDHAMIGFMKWCSSIQEPKLDLIAQYYIVEVPQVSLTNQIVNLKCFQASFINEKTNTIDFDGSKLTVNPIVNEIDISETLLREKILILISTEFTHSLTTIKLNAVIPHQGAYYLYNSKYYFKLFLNLENLKANNIQEGVERAAIVAEAYFNNKPLSYLELDNRSDNVGFVSGPLYEILFKYRFTGMSTPELQQIDINPQNEKITIADILKEK